MLFSTTRANLAAETSGNDTQSVESIMRQQIIGFLQSGGKPSDLPPSHLLHPLSKAPLTAMTSFLVMNGDAAMMERFYPVISRITLDNFKDDALTRHGFIKGSPARTDTEKIALSPSVNSLAAIELHALSMIAAGAGKYEEALELHLWSKQLAAKNERTFFDHSMDAFFPVSEKGHYLTLFTPEFLLPMVIDRMLGPSRRISVADRSIYKTASGQGGEMINGAMWDDPDMRPVVFSLLSNIDKFPIERLAQLYDQKSKTGGTGSRRGDNEWTGYWSRPGRSNALFPRSDIISSLVNFTSILKRESLLNEKYRAALYSDVEALSSILEKNELDLENHISSITIVNRLLMSVGEVSSILNAGDKLWKILDETRWNRLSPRTRKIVAKGSVESIEELLEAKAALSAMMMETTGIEAAVTVPEKAVRTGEAVPVGISLGSARAPLEIKRLYIQISGNRWMLADEGISVAPGAPEDRNRWERMLVLPPSSEPGVVTLPLFFDFMHEGKRIEIHMVESVTLTTGYDLSLEFPAGRRLSEGRPVPVNISVRYRPDQRLQGIVDGVFLEKMSCSPELPARFIIDPSREITTLPLEISLAGGLSPGVYPFSLSVILDGKRIALFEEKLLRPFDWLHLGPVKNRRWALEEAVQLQDDLYSTYMSVDGRTLRWRNVAPGAIDSRGAVLPDRLYGSGSERAMLLYTAVELTTGKKVKWSIDTPNSVSFWINSTEILSASSTGQAYSGTAVLRKGHNSLLISSFWTDQPSPVLLTIVDESGLPVAGLVNKTYSMPDDPPSDRINTTGQIAGEVTDQPRGVTFSLNYPDATEVSVIGEFNNWAADAAPMRKSARGTWQALLTLPSGRYTYRFLIDKKLKIIDPANENQEPDGFGSFNSVLIVK